MTQRFAANDKTLLPGVMVASLRGFPPFALVACLVLVWQPASAEVTIQERTQSYSIMGLSNKQLLEEIRAKGPHSEKMGRRVHGNTRHKITWRTSYHVREGQCVINQVQVQLDITFTMPSWVNEISGSDTLKKQWRQYYSALQEHENGHKQLAVDAAHEIDRGIAALEPRANCDALKAAANAVGKRVHEELHQRNADYDLTTGHGKTQGVRL